MPIVSMPTPLYGNVDDLRYITTDITSILRNCHTEAVEDFLDGLEYTIAHGHARLSDHACTQDQHDVCRYFACVSRFELLSRGWIPDA